MKLIPSASSIHANLFHVVFLISLGAVVVNAQVWTPPPEPEVAPIISESYEADQDGDCIEDELQLDLEVESFFSRYAITTQAQRQAETALQEIVDVELIFKEQITQQQIDDFLLLGGKIDYIYEAVSYGWRGQIPLGSIDHVAAFMGPSLVLIEKLNSGRLLMDEATQTGRVRPIWRPGFAGNELGFDGDPSITIGLIDTGVDASHSDLDGHLVYWKDLSGGSPHAVDFHGHGSHLAGIVVGSGIAGGIGQEIFRWTALPPATEPINIVGNGAFTVDAIWGSEVDADFFLLEWLEGKHVNQAILEEAYSIPLWFPQVNSPLSESGAVNGKSQHNYLPHLQPIGNSGLNSPVMLCSIDTYPASGDSLPKFRGVAPMCNLAAIRVFDDKNKATPGGYPDAQDHLVKDRRRVDNVKLVNVSLAATENHTKFGTINTESQSWRQKTNSAVANGVLVVVAAGNEADDGDDEDGWNQPIRRMADPARAALALTVGASNDHNTLTSYSTYGFGNPRASEDYKPDLIAPGGSGFYTGIVSVDSGSSDGIFVDQEPNDYAVMKGTSAAAPFVTGCAALVIDAMQEKGVEWDFTSDALPRFVKMVLCATATETNQPREDGRYNPTLERNRPGPKGFPAGKDPNEGYGIINPDAAVEAVYADYKWGTTETDSFGSGYHDRRAWARSVVLYAGQTYTITLTNPDTGDFDLYLYSAEPSASGAPQILAASASPKPDEPDGKETITFTTSVDTEAILVVKRVSGDGEFRLMSRID